MTAAKIIIQKSSVTERDCFEVLIPLSANPTKWSNTLKRFVGNLPTNYLNVFDHFVGFALKGLIFI